MAGMTYAGGTMTPTTGSLPPDTSWWDWVLANGPGISAVAAAVGAAAAIVAAIIGLRSLLRAARDSRDRSRPVMVAELNPHPVSDLYFQLTIRNSGPSLARNVRVTFDPALPTTPVEGWPSGVYFHRMFANPIETFGPGQALASTWCALKDTEVPERCAVSFRYEDAHGQRFTDEFVIDLAPYRALLTVTSDTSIEGRLTTLAAEAKAQTTAQQAIARHLSRRDNSG